MKLYSSLKIKDTYGEPTIYDADGDIISQSAYGNRFMFTGREYDAETGNYYVRTRYYSPKIGGFMSPDTIRYRGGLNLYTYCGNNPINRIDPWGLDFTNYKVGYTPIGTVVGAAAGVISGGVPGFFTGLALGGLTINGGVMVDSKNQLAVPYVGLDWTTNPIPMPSGSISSSKNCINVGSGLSVSGSRALWGGYGLFGHSFGSGNYGEVGFGGPPGWAGGATYGFGPYNYGNIMQGLQQAASQQQLRGIMLELNMHYSTDF